MKTGPELDRFVSLWDAINRYVETCGGKPNRHVYGNTNRQRAVVEIEEIVSNATAQRKTTGKTDCYLYETKSGWHWEVVGKGWVLSDHLGDCGQKKGYRNRGAALKAATEACKSLGIEFSVDLPF